MLDLKNANINEKPVIKVVNIIAGTKGNRPDEVHYRDRLTVGKVAIWSGEHYPGHSAPGLYQTESSKYNSRSGEQEVEKVRYQNLVVMPDEDTDWNKGTSLIEQLSAGCAVAYQLYTGEYAKNLKQFVQYKKEAKNRYNCGTCAYRKKVEFVQETDSGLTDDDGNYTYFCGLCNKEITENYREAFHQDREDVIGDTNYKSILQDCFHQGFRNAFSDGEGSDMPCPYHDKFYKRNNGLGWYRENPKPFFPIQSFDDEEGNRFYGIEFENFVLDITFALKNKLNCQIGKLVGLFKKYRLGLDKEEAGLMINVLLKGKSLVPKVREQVIKRFVNMKGGE